MSFDKLCALNKHSARAACRVEDAAMIRLNHLNDELDNRCGCEKLSAPLSLAHGEFAEKVFINLPEHVPFDIHWESDTITKLWRNNVDIVAPLTFCEDVFYDTWAMVKKNGKRWPAFNKAWAEDNLAGELLEMDLIGGTLLIDAKVLRAGARYTEAAVDHGLIMAAKRHGFKPYVDTSVWVQHPKEEPKPWVW